jgi:hypothetical protein
MSKRKKDDKKESSDEDESSDEKEESEDESDGSEEEEETKKNTKKPPAKKKTNTKKPAKKRKKKDPNAPKNATTAYNFFTQAKKKEFQEKHPDMKWNDIRKKISQAWKDASEDDKKPYQDMHLKDKERFQKEKENYTKAESDSDSSSESESSSAEKKKKSKGKGKKKKAKKEKDPDAPRSKTNAYMYFQKDQRDKIKKESGLKGVPELAKKMGAIWREMTEAEKKPYTDLALKDKERYDREMEVYKKKKKEED